MPKMRRKLPKGIHVHESGSVYICYKNEHGRIIRENTHQTDINAAKLMLAQARTDVAMKSAGITLVSGDLRGVIQARRLSVAMMRNIRENLFFAFAYNMVGVPMAAGLFGFTLGPMFAAAAMTFSSVSVIGNALRLRGVKL